jgi:hypothetical protein
MALSAEASFSILACLAAQLDAPGKYVFALYVAAPELGAIGASSFAILAQLLVFPA